MVLNISSLLSGEKNRLDIDYMLSVSTDDVGNAVNLAGVTFPTPARVTGVITDNAGYMRLSLSATLPYKTVCARCACDIEGEFEIEFERTVVPAGMVEDAEEKEDRPHRRTGRCAHRRAFWPCLRRALFAGGPVHRQGRTVGAAQVFGHAALAAASAVFL